MILLFHDEVCSCSYSVTLWKVCVQGCGIFKRSQILSDLKSSLVIPEFLGLEGTALAISMSFSVGYGCERKSVTPSLYVDSA